MDDRRTQIMGEITALKSLLSDSDFQLFKLVENMTDCTGITGLLALFRSFLTEFGPLVASRRAWRTKINELEEELDSLVDGTPAE